MSQRAATRGKGQTRVRDPACGMWIEPRLSARRFEYEGETYYFCSQQCLETFQAGAERTRARHEIEARILGALHNHTMRTVAQPIVSLPDRRLVGVEALARFDEPPHAPEAWFEQARSVGMQVDLEFVIVANVIDVGSPHIGEKVLVHVNLSPDSILNTRFDDMLHAPQASRLVIEVTEHEYIADYGAVRAALAPFRAQGGMLAVDDAGSGYASLRHILELRPDVIKLDASIVRTVDTDIQHKAIVSSLVAFGRTVGAAVLAEGVEAQGQLEELIAIGVTEGQGFLLGPPVEWDDFDRRSP